MKKRILSILLLCCMVLTLLPLPLPVSAAATGAMDNIPGRFDKEIDLVNEKGDINIGDSKTYYIYSSSNDPEWVWTKKIQVNGSKAAPHIFLDNVNIQVKEDAKTPAIELHGKASAYLYFINRDSKLTGATGRAAIQKNRSEGQLCVQVMKGTTVTCQGGFAGAGIGGSFATRNIADKVFNIDMYGHGVNMHFGSQTNPSLWSGTIIAKGGKYSAGIGGGRGGSGEKLYFYSGKIEATGGPMGAGIGGSFKGRGSDIYKIEPTDDVATAVFNKDSEDYWQQTAEATSPQLQMVAVNEQMAKQQEKLAKSELLPKVAVVAQNNLNGPITFELPPIDKNLNVWYVGIGVKYQLSSIFKSNKKLNQAKLQSKAASEQKAVAAEQLNNNVQAAHTNYLQSYVELETQQKNVQLAQQIYEVVNTNHRKQQP